MPGSRLQLTRHFREQWALRGNGPVPAPEDVAVLIREAVRVQNFRVAFTAKGFRLKILAMYWHPEQNLILKVDELRDTVVTVLTPATERDGKNAQY